MFDVEDLVAMRRVGDPIADEVVRAQVRDDPTQEATELPGGPHPHPARPR